MRIHLACWLALATACRAGAPKDEVPSQAMPSARETTATDGARTNEVVIGTSKLVFASREEGAELLGTTDAFVTAMSAHDRSLRSSTTEPVDEARYLAHARAQATDWPEAARERWRKAAAELTSALQGLALPLPEKIVLVATTGKEEFGAPHTRKNAVVVPVDAISKIENPLALLAHEVLHVATRHAPKVRDPLYAVLGFEPTSPISFPAALEARRLTNPDAHEHRHAILVRLAAGGEVRVVPVLSTKGTAEDAISAGLAKSIQLSLVEVGSAKVHAPPTTDYLKRASLNTSYAIHPEETLAENFALLVRRRAGANVDAADVAVLEKLESALTSLPR